MTKHITTPRQPAFWTNAAIVAAFALGAFALHFPGQASVDTALQLHDGYTRHYTSNQPPAMSLLLDILTMPGVLALDIGLFALAILRLVTTSTATGKQSRLVIAAFFICPVLLTYVGIVWKDVLFAHGALLALLLLPRGASLCWKSLVASALVMALAVAVRQQGVVVIAPTLFYLLLAEGWGGLKRIRRWSAALAWTGLFLVCSMAVKHYVHATGDTSGSVAVEGPLRQLAMFDLGGIASRLPDPSFPAIEQTASTIPIAHRPTHDHILSVLVGRYSPDRQDHMSEPDETAIWFTADSLFKDWRTNALKHPLAYLAHRLDVLSWILGCHGPEKCLPFHFGITAGPDNIYSELGIIPETSSRASFLDKIARSTMFLFYPVFYVALSLAITVLLISRGWRDHSQMIAIQIAGLTYAATYLFVGFACDFRYTYFTTICSLFGVGYVILSVPLKTQFVARNGFRRTS